MSREYTCAGVDVRMSEDIALATNASLVALEIGSGISDFSPLREGSIGPRATMRSGSPDEGRPARRRTGMREAGPWEARMTASQGAVERV